MPSPSLESQLQAELDAWRDAGLDRSLREASGRDFTSNDYLALARDPRLIAAAHEALDTWGAGSPSARLLRGHLAPHAAAERAAADWLGCQRALLLPSGWQANQALLGCVAEAGDLLLSDAANHASLIDGARLCRAGVEVFEHNDPAHLAELLRAGRGARRRWIVCESVFSMDGDLAPLTEYQRLAEEHDAWLIVDEAHAAGLFGPQGAGRCAELEDQERVFARTITGGKALGVCGGFIAGSQRLIELLLHKGRAFVFTTAATPATAAALHAAIAVARGEPERRRRAHAAAALLRECLQEHGLAASGASPIVPVLIGAAQNAVAVAAGVQEQGFDVRALRPPTVPPGSSRLRLVCHADHTETEVRALAAAVAAAVAADAGELQQPTTAAEGVSPAAAPAAAGRGLVVAGSGTGVGKTVVSALLVRAAAHAGVSAQYWKPVQTGTESDTRQVAELAGLDPMALQPPAVELALPASVDQAAAAEGRRIEVAGLVAGARARFEADPETAWILECAGGLRVPWNESEDQLDFLARLRLPLVLVADSGLGTLNHTLLSLEAARARRLRVAALFLVGARHPGNAATLRARLDMPLYELPRLEPLTTATLDAWLAHHDLGKLLP